jgi:hypothetical protein
MAADLGYEQVSATTYVKECAGWYECFGLQASSGNDFFYINYGISTPKLCPVGEDQSILTFGLLLWKRLDDSDGSGAFPRETTEAVEASAVRALAEYKIQAVPWFQSLSQWDAIAAEYLRTNPISEARVGHHSSGFGEGFRSATYGYLLLKAGLTSDGLRWLHEARRILSLPEYITRDGRLVHEKEKHARLQNPDDHSVKTLSNVEQTIRLVAEAPV